MDYYIQTTIDNRNANYVVNTGATGWVFVLKGATPAMDLAGPVSEGWVHDCTATPFPIEQVRSARTRTRGLTVSSLAQTLIR